MGKRLAVLLDDARRRAFVGRTDAFASFRAALAGDDARRVLFVHGPGGIGKTTLLDQLRLRAQDSGRDVVYLNGCELDLRAEDLPDITEDAASQGGVVLVDGYERLAGLDRWIRESWLPDLSADAVVVLAGRMPPATEWQTDPGWRSVVAIHRLDPLDDVEAAQLLVRAGAPAGSLRRLVELGQGHPLALSLLGAAAARGEVPNVLGDIPDILAALLPVITDTAPDEDHALGLELCAYARVLTSQLLDDAVGDRAGEVWQWLATRSFISHGAHGLHPHDLARDVLETEHRRRSPDGRRRALGLIVAHTTKEMRQVSGAEQLRTAAQLVWLLRDTVGAPYAATLTDEALSLTPGRPSDHQAVVELLARHAGDEESRHAERWLRAQPASLRVIREGPDVRAFSMWVRPTDDPELATLDPQLRHILDAIARLGPLRPGEGVAVGRFKAGTGDYRTDPHPHAVTGVSMVAEIFAGPLAWTWVTSAAPELFDEMMLDDLLFPHRVPVGPGVVAYGIDWRRISFERYSAILLDRLHTGERGPLDPSILRPPPMPREAFDRAVRDGLRALHRPELLADSPLMGTALAATASGPDREQIRRRLAGSIERIGLDPAASELFGVLERTYLHPAATQEAAARSMHLSFSTYRRRLAAAHCRVVDDLWAVELGLETA